MADASYDVYLSYNYADAEVVRDLARRLTDRGLSVWIDTENLQVGDEWQTVLTGALEQTRAVALCVGARGFAQGQLMELGAAEARATRDPDFRFFPLLLPGLTPTFSGSELPAGLARRQWIDLRAGLDDGAALQLLVSALRAAPAPTDESPPATESVRHAARNLSGAVTAAAFVVELLKLHPEYGDRRGGEIELDLQSGATAPTEEWLNRVRARLDRTTAKELHGRLLIVGLARVDSVVRGQLEHGGFLAAVEREIWEPMSTLFPDAPADPEEAVPMHTDNPAIVDALNREGFARILARRIRDTREREVEAAKAIGDKDFPSGRSFLVHIHGPWGIGKTSLLNFLRDELHRAPKPWVVVTFNAWQHQRVVPPWWWLMSAVYRQGFHELWRISPARALLFRGREWFWRIRGGWPGYVMLVAGAALLVLVWRLGFFDSFANGKSFSVETVQGLIVGLAAVLTPLLVIWGAARSASRWLLTTSSRGARVYLDHARDPMEATKNHFAELVEWLGNPLVILVDDLDRCKGPYVVELLEGIQTLFRDVPVSYVVAADRDWLADSYACEYDSFASVADEPGRPLGYLFLEKTFQLTLSVPTMAETTRDGFWRELIRPTHDDSRAELGRAREEADQAFADLHSEEAVRAELVREPGKTPAEQRARLEAAAIQLATPMAETAAEHVLQPFRPLLDANPRAMKRLVNAYGLARGIELLSAHVGGGKEAQHRTALWAILTLRWPRLAEYLAAHPETAAAITNGTETEIPEELRLLFADDKVKAVVEGDAEGIQAKLDPDSIRLCVTA